MRILTHVSTSIQTKVEVNLALEWQMDANWRLAMSLGIQTPESTVVIVDAASIIGKLRGTVRCLPFPYFD